MTNKNLVITIAQAEGSHGREIAEALAQRLNLTYVDETLVKLATRNLDHSKIETYIREMAQQGQVVIVGCGANFILQDMAGVRNLLIEAPLPCRVERVMQELQLSESSAEQRVCQTDGRYAAYVRAYYGPDWTSCDLYDLVLNTGRLTDAEAVETLSCFVEGFDQTQTPCEPVVSKAPDAILAQRYQRVAELLHQ